MEENLKCYDCLHYEQNEAEFQVWGERCWECVRNDFCNFAEAQWVLKTKGCVLSVLLEFNWDKAYDIDVLYNKIANGIRSGLYKSFRDVVEIALMSYSSTDRERELFYKRLVAVLEERGRLQKDEDGHYIIELEDEDE